MPSPADQLPPNAQTLALKIRRLERDVRELRAARRLSHAAISDGPLEIRDPSGASSRRIVLDPAGLDGTAPALLLYTGSDLEIAPARIYPVIDTNHGPPQPFISVDAPSVGGDPAGFYFLSGGGNDNRQGEWDLTTGSGSGGVSRVYAYASDGGANPGQVSLAVYEPSLDGSASLTILGQSLDWTDTNGLGMGVVDGVLTASSMAFGSVTITPSAANTPTSYAVTGLSIAGSTFHAYVTAESSVPGTTVTGVSANNISSTGLTVWLTRANTTPTVVHWMVIGT